MIRLLNLGPAKHEKVAIYAVNQRIANADKETEMSGISFLCEVAESSAGGKMSVLIAAAMKL